MIKTENSVKEQIVDIAGIEDRAFPATFWILKVAGFWAPTSIKLKFAYICYQCYTVFSFMSIVTLIVSLLLSNVLSDESILSLINYWYMLVIWCNGLMKVINLLSRRDRVIYILQNSIMTERWSNPQDKEESGILKESQYSENLVALFYLAMIIVNGLSISLRPILNDNPNHMLIFECYTPCNRSSAVCYWTFYVHQFFECWIVSIIHVGCDCLIFNFIERISSQLKIFQHRLTKLPQLVKQNWQDDISTLENEKKCLRQYIEDHHNIYKTVKYLNDTFYGTVCIQFVSSISVICTNIFLLSKQDLFSVDFITAFAYLCCVLVQNFFYCWYGYKVSENNAEIVTAIFNMEWTLLKKEVKQMLLFVMLSASKNITLFNNALVNLTPEMFLKILKVSYSAFNLLTQT